MRILVQPASYRYREHQWTATVGDYDLGVPVGSGATPLEAVSELLWKMDLEDDTPYCMEVRDR
jgi:hypothetical protein